MEDALGYTERAAEIAARIMVAMVAPGGNSSASWITSPEAGGKCGAAARAAYEEIYKGVRGCLEGPSKGEV